VKSGTGSEAQEAAKEAARVLENEHREAIGTASVDDAQVVRGLPVEKPRPGKVQRRG
jgi:hypothetical protein